MTPQFNHITLPSRSWVWNPPDRALLEINREINCKNRITWSVEIKLFNFPAAGCHLYQTWFPHVPLMNGGPEFPSKCCEILAFIFRWPVQMSNAWAGFTQQNVRSVSQDEFIQAEVINIIRFAVSYYIIDILHLLFIPSICITSGSGFSVTIFPLLIHIEGGSVKTWLWLNCSVLNNSLLPLLCNVAVL